jgi:pyruvate formate lyase activating enzyme
MGTVFNIQRFSLHDGAGIRTLVFFKGCPLACKWCSNPEGQSYSPELAYKVAKCIGAGECGLCTRACKHEAVRMDDQGRARIERNLCDNCGECAGVCPSKALEILGKPISVDEVIKKVEQDSAFYARSGGGLTLSGGEPVLQADFAIALLETARSRGIDTAVETSGFCKWDDLEAVCRRVNQIFFDIKSMDAQKHREWTRVDNEPILENLRKLVHAFPRLPLTVRTPIIPGFNDSVEDIALIRDFLNRITPSAHHELLAYHRFGEPKYQQLGKRYELEGVEPPSQEKMALLRQG